MGRKRDGAHELASFLVGNPWFLLHHLFLEPDISVIREAKISDQSLSLHRNINLEHQPILNNSYMLKQQKLLIFSKVGGEAEIERDTYREQMNFRNTFLQIKRIGRVSLTSYSEPKHTQALFSFTINA